jgi:hypothetical protein
MMEAEPTSQTSFENNFTWQYIPEDKSEHHSLYLFATVVRVHTRNLIVLFCKWSKQ